MKMDTPSVDISGAGVVVAEEREARSIRVRRMVTEVEAALRNETPAQVSSRFADWQAEFPKIFEMVLTRSYPREVLEMMLKNLEKMESGSLSQHNASVAVGSVLVDTFVKPQLKNAPTKPPAGAYKLKKD
jgi:hypothetical protein